MSENTSNSMSENSSSQKNNSSQKSQSGSTESTDLHEALCQDAPDQEACSRFVERLSEAHENIDPQQ